MLHSHDGRVRRALNSEAEEQESHPAFATYNLGDLEQDINIIFVISKMATNTYVLPTFQNWDDQNNEYRKSVKSILGAPGGSVD